MLDNVKNNFTRYKKFAFAWRRFNLEGSYNLFNNSGFWLSVIWSGSISSTNFVSWNFYKSLFYMCSFFKKLNFEKNHYFALIFNRTNNLIRCSRREEECERIGQTSDSQNPKIRNSVSLNPYNAKSRKPKSPNTR